MQNPWKMHYLFKRWLLFIVAPKKSREQAHTVSACWWSGQAVAVSMTSSCTYCTMTSFISVRITTLLVSLGILQHVQMWVADFNFDYPIGNIKI